METNDELTDEEASNLIRQRVDVTSARANRRPFERQLMKNRAFFFGKQYIVEDPRTGDLRDLRDVPPRRILHKVNLMQGDILRSMLTVSGANGEFVVPPKKAERRAERAAWVSTKLFEHLSEVMELEELDEQATLMAAIDGSTIWKVTWDPNAGEMRRFYNANEEGTRALGAVDPETARRLEREGKFQDFAVGDVQAELCSLLQIWWDWRARERGFERPCEWAAQGSVVSHDWLKARYPDKDLSGVIFGKQWDGSLYYNEMISYLSGNTMGYPGLMDDDRSKLTLHIEYWEVPLPGNKNLGRRIDWAGGKVLKNGPNDYRVTRFPLPFVRQNWITAMGRFWGISLAESMIHPQAALNRAMSRKLEFVDSHGAPNTFIPRAWKVPKENLTNQTGAVHEYDHMQGGDVKYGPTPDLPKEISEVTAEQRSAMGEISSAQSIDNAKLPGQIRSAPGLEFMQEQRDKQLVHAAKNFLRAKRKVGCRALALVRAFGEPERVLRYVGSDRKFRVASFFASDIDADLRVMVDPGKLLASPAAVRARVAELVQNGVLNPAMNPEDRDDVLRAHEFVSSDGLMTDRLVETENQEREIAEIIAEPERWIEARADMMAPEETDPETGQPMPRIVRGYPTNPFDDDESHARTLRRFCRSEEFRDLPRRMGQSGVMAQSALLLHLQEHESKIQAAMEQQMMLQQLAQGSPGAKGEPSRPRQPAAL